MPITRVNEFHALPEKAADLRAFLEDVVLLIEDAPGCISVTLFAHHDDVTRFAIIEEWQSIDAHQASVTRIPPDKLNQVRTLIAEPPKGVYYQAI